MRAELLKPHQDLEQSQLPGTVLDALDVQHMEQTPRERTSSWNIETTPAITEAVNRYFDHEGDKVNAAVAELKVLEWGEAFRKGGAQLPDDPELRQEAAANLQTLGYKNIEQEPPTARGLSLALNSRIIRVCLAARNIYALPALPITFITAEEVAAAERLGQRIENTFVAIKAGSEKLGVVTGGIEEFSPSQPTTDKDNPRKLIDPERTKTELGELADSSNTMYVHTTNFLDGIIDEGALRPRAEGGVATTGSHSAGVHFSRDTRDTPHFSMDGPGLSDYLLSIGKTRANLLPGDVVFPLGAIVTQTPIRAEVSTPLYDVRHQSDGSSSTVPLNLYRPGALDYVKLEQKRVDEASGTTQKQAGDTLFFASEDPEQANVYEFPIEQGYLIVKDQADGDRATQRLKDKGFSEEWITEHLIVSQQGNGLQVARERINRQSPQLVVPLQAKSPPWEYRDYLNGQFDTTTELITLPVGSLHDVRSP